jgi:carboxyl-terminal processing protease
VFHTKKGRKVYGGGGIQPDVTLPYILDTNWVYYNRLLDKQVLEDVLQKDLYNNYSQLVEQYPDADAFVKNYKVPEQTWQRILLCADKKGIRRHPGALNKYADHIRNRYKSLMAQSLFDENAFYRVYVPYDNELQRALHAKRK